MGRRLDARQVHPVPPKTELDSRAYKVYDNMACANVNTQSLGILRAVTRDLSH